MDDLVQMKLSIGTSIEYGVSLTLHELAFRRQKLDVEYLAHIGRQ